MIKKKSKFFTFIFSFLPGAGHMYMGFVKQGVSIMSLFFGIIFLAAFLQIEAVLFLMPVVWCYGFFDAINKNSLSDEEFYTLEDNYLFHVKENSWSEWNLGKLRPIIAILFILIGANMLFHNFLDFVVYYLPDSIRYSIYHVTNNIPQVAIAVFIIYVGVRLIIGKKKELEGIE